VAHLSFRLNVTCRFRSYYKARCRARKSFFWKAQPPEPVFIGPQRWGQSFERSVALPSSACRKMLLGSSGGEQFLVMLPEEVRQQADDFLNAATVIRSRGLSTSSRLRLCSSASAVCSEILSQPQSKRLVGHATLAKSTILLIVLRVAQRVQFATFLSPPVVALSGRREPFSMCLFKAPIGAGPWSGVHQLNPPLVIRVDSIPERLHPKRYASCSVYPDNVHRRGIGGG
jgi:hypothetical protein